MQRTFVALLFLLGGCSACQAADWRLLWSDEFEGTLGSAPDPKKWTYDLGAGGWGNQELETYTSNSSNMYQDGKGHLVISVLRDAAGKYTSARLKTEGRFSVTYGKIAARMKIPRGQGLWPAFWMLGTSTQQTGWPECGEIDIMENIGKEPAIVHGTVHGPGYSGANGITAQYKLPSKSPLADDFHVYAVEWSPTKIMFLLDDHSYAVVDRASLPENTKWVFNQPFYLLLNVAVGGNWPGNPGLATVFPQELIVDWVRVFQTE